jgi:hypothetical protein
MVTAHASAPERAPGRGHPLRFRFHVHQPIGLFQPHVSVRFRAKGPPWSISLRD